MRKYIILFLVVILSCNSEEIKSPKFKVDRVNSTSNLPIIHTREMLFSVTIDNQDSIPIYIQTNSDDNFFSPLGTTYSYFDSTENKRKHHKGIGDNFSSTKEIIKSGEKRIFYFIPPFSENVDTVEFYFPYKRANKNCGISLKYSMKDHQITDLLKEEKSCK